MKESGLLEKLTAEWFGDEQKNCDEVVSEDLGWERTVMPFMLLIVALPLSLFLVVGEVVHDKIKNVWREKQSMTMIKSRLSYAETGSIRSGRTVFWRTEARSPITPLLNTIKDDLSTPSINPISPY